MREPVTKYTEPYSLYELMEGLQTDDLKLTDTRNNETVTFCTDAQARGVLDRFRDRLFLVPSTEELTTTQKRTTFLALYNAWWNRRKYQYIRMMEAITAEYDPLENYDRREEGKIIDTHEIGARSGTDNLTDTWDETKRTTTEKPGTTVTVTDTPRVVVETAESVYGDNSDTEVPSSVSTVTPTEGTNVSETVSRGQNKIEVADDEREDTHNRSTSSEAATDTDTHEFDGYRVHGNVGVTSSFQLVSGDIEMRSKFDVIMVALLEFLNINSVYV